MKKTLKSLIEQQQEEQKLKKLQRQQKAALKFSKQRFIKNVPIPKQQKATEIDQNQQAQINFVKKNLKTDLLQMLQNMGVDFEDKEKNISWLNLSFFDYKARQESQLGDDKQNDQVSGRCLANIEGRYTYVKGTVIGYVKEKQKYKFIYTTEHGQVKKMLVPRVYICLDTDEPRYYCERVTKAFYSRILTDNMIKLKYYVDSMPTEGLNKLNQDQKGRVKILVQNMRQFSDMEEEVLFEEVEDDYFKTMNSIIARKHLTESRGELVPTGLIVSVQKSVKPAPQNGLIDIKRGKTIVVQDNERYLQQTPSLAESFRTFCTNTIYSQKTVVISLKDIQYECQKSMSLQLFKITKDKKQSVRFEQYQTEHNTYIQRTINRLRNSWVANIKEIIQTNFKKNPVPWFNFGIDPVSYNGSKIQRYFKVVKYIMETSLRQMSMNSFNRFYTHIVSYIPDRVEVVSINQVRNYFGDRLIVTTKQSAQQDTEEFMPLFETDLMRALDDSAFNYATGIPNFTNIIINIFNRMIQEINKVPQVEQKIMIQMFKKQKSQRHLSAPNRKGVKNAGQIDINDWLIQLHDTLKKKTLKCYLTLSKIY